MKVFLFLILNTVVFSMLLAQLPPLIDREIFFGDPEISGAQVSPDGKFISFLKPYNSVRNIWVKGIDDPFDKAYPITNDTTRPVSGYFWSRDGKFVLYVQDKGGDENYHIYAVNPAETGNPVPAARDLTPFPKVRAMIYSVPRFDPSIIFIGLNDRKAELHDVYRLNINSGERTLIRKNDDNIVGWDFDAVGNLRLGTRQTSDGGTELLKVDGDILTSIYTVNSEESVGTYRFTPDGKSVYISTNKGDIDKTQLEILDLSTLKSKLVEKDPENQVDLGGAFFSEINDKLLATYYVGDRMRMYFHDAQMEKDYEALKKKLPLGEISIGNMTSDENLWMVTVSSDVDPGSRYLYNRKSKTVTLLYKSRPNLPSEHLAPMKPMTYDARDGMKIHGYLTIPKGSSGKNLPTVMFIHGGPWARDMWGYNSIAQFLANRGYAVFQPNFRGSTGYGKKYLNAGNKQWGIGAMQHDITDAVNFLIEKGIADKNKVAICGGSYGGYATLAGLAFTPDLYAAGFDIVGPSNIITLLNSIPPYWAPIKKIFAVRVGDMENPVEKKMLEKQSPLYSAKNIKAPLFVAQGANDPRVKKAESDQIVIAMRDLARKVEYMVAPDEGHGYAGRENRIAMFFAMEKFFAKYLGGRMQVEVPEDIQKRYNEIMVDVTTVTMPKVASTSPSGMFSFDPKKIKEGTFLYEMKMLLRGQAMNMEVQRDVKFLTNGKTKVLQVVESMNGSMGSGTDTTIFDGQTLHAVSRTASQGFAKMQFSFTDSKVEGKIEMGERSLPVNIVLDGPAFPDASASGLIVATLPFHEGYTAGISMIETMTAKVKKYTVKFIGKEPVTIPKGTFDAIKVEMFPVDGDGMKGTFWLSAEDRVALKAETVLPAMMGGGTMTSELK